jgi:hypothetical protein
MKLLLAAPLNGLPSLLKAFGSQASFLHFLTNAVFAAPASGFPSLPTLSFASALRQRRGRKKSCNENSYKGPRRWLSVIWQQVSRTSDDGLC